MASVLFTRFLACSVGIGLLTTIVMVTAPNWSRFFAAKWSMRLWGIFAACLCFPLTPGIPALEEFFRKYPWLIALWLVITILILAFLFLRQNQFRKDVLQWGEKPTNATYELKAARLAEELNMKCPAIYITTKISCPTILGMGAPLLLLPQEVYSDAEFDIILRHEFYHYLHAHIPYKVFLSIVCALHWFNPAVWLMRQKAELDLEAACDDALLLSASDKTRKQYSDTVLSVMQTPSRCKSPFSTHSYGDPEATGRRLVRLLAPPPKNGGAVLLCMGIVLSLLSGTVIATTTARLEAPTTPTMTPPSESTVSSSSDFSSAQTLTSESSSEEPASENMDSSVSSDSSSDIPDIASSELENVDESSTDESTASSEVSSEPTSSEEDAPAFPDDLLQAVNDAFPDTLHLIQQPAKNTLVTSEGLEGISIPGTKSSSMPSDEVFIQVINQVVDAYNNETADTSMADPDKPRLMPMPSSLKTIPEVSASEDFTAIPRTSNGYSIVVPISSANLNMQIWADDNGPDSAYSFDIVAVNFVTK